MKKKKKKKMMMIMIAGPGVAGLFGLLLPGLASAEGTACGSETVIVPDGRIMESTIPATTTFWFLADLTSGRSYSVEVRSKVGTFGTTPGTFSIFGAPNVCPPTALAGTTNTVGTDPQFPATGSRVSFTAATTRHRVSINNTTGASVDYTITISDTTQFSPAWSTISSFDTFYSFYNTTNSTCNVTLTMVDTGGTLRTTFSGAVTTGTTLSTNTSALGTARGMAGTAKLTHDCPPGGILAEAAIANFSISPTPYFQFIHFQPTRESAH